MKSGYGLKRRQALMLLGAGFLPGFALSGRAMASTASAILTEPDFLAAKLSLGQVPPMSVRLPDQPRVVALGKSGRVPGQYGGTLRMQVGSQRDIRYVPIYSYCRLVGYDENFNFVPDILLDFHVQDERIFTFTLRAGHCWSDGSPFTAEDFRYVWEDMFHTKKLYRGGTPAVFRVNGKEPIFEIIDQHSVRYTFEAPNPDFLAELASPVGQRLMMPSTYLKQFHPKYQSKERLDALILANGVEDWVALHQKMSRYVRPENPALPGLDPWINRTAPPAEQFIFERNPYFHRVDERGQQLPYVDRIVLNVGAGDLISAKTGTGESDLQMSGLDFVDYTFLKSAEKRYPIKVDLWKRTQGSRVALIPNLNCKDDVWRKHLWDVRVRRALSLGINRDEVNKAVFFGLAEPAANSILPESPLFKQAYRNAYALYDPDEANRLLDEAGMPRPHKHGERYLSDGRPAYIIIETTGESAFDSDVLELVSDHWRRLGIRVFVHISHRELFRRRITNGETVMAIWQGLDNGVPTADMSPKELAPTNDDQVQWPLWGLHHMSGGGDGHPPELDEAKQLLALYNDWRRAQSLQQRTDIWHAMLALFTDQVFTIGLVNSALVPVVKSTRLQNMPEKALFGFEPTGYLGVYMPDSFWFEGDM